MEERVIIISSLSCVIDRMSNYDAVSVFDDECLGFVTHPM